MVIVENVNGVMIANIIHHSRFTIYQRKEEHRAPLLHTSPVDSFAILLTRRLNVYVDLLRAAAAKQAPPKNIAQSQNQNHEDYQNCDNSCAAATTIFIVSHNATPPVL